MQQIKTAVAVVRLSRNLSSTLVNVPTNDSFRMLTNAVFDFASEGFSTPFLSLASSCKYAFKTAQARGCLLPSESNVKMYVLSGCQLAEYIGLLMCGT